jgi:hypothetical protein
MLVGYPDWVLLLCPRLPSAMSAKPTSTYVGWNHPGARPPAGGGFPRSTVVERIQSVKRKDGAPGGCNRSVERVVRVTVAGVPRLPDQGASAIT